MFGGLSPFIFHKGNTTCLRELYGVNGNLVPSIDGYWSARVEICYLAFSHNMCTNKTTPEKWVLQCFRNLFSLFFKRNIMIIFWLYFSQLLSLLYNKNLCRMSYIILHSGMLNTKFISKFELFWSLTCYNKQTEKECYRGLVYFLTVQ